MKIATPTKSDYMKLITVWEASVRATHHFLSEADILSLKPLILEHYFDAIDLRVVKCDGGNIIGFIGVAEENIEMLFVTPEFFNQGAGSQLLQFAIENQQAKKVDVNEQNPSAVGFYQHFGFSIVDRSPLDGQGQPFPLLHMQL